MNSAFAPASVAEMVDAVRSCPRVLACGAGTKTRLAAVKATRISTTRLRGMVEYEPSEFTFTALAGTPLLELVETLAARGQYLPFDPLWVQSGATLGGTVAAGISGPGRLRFGGIRDFILGVQFVDGLGRALRTGGKVVKNAAGFDLPKFLVGSLGRFGVMLEATFKVFPTPPASLTLKLAADDIAVATRILVEAAGARWETDALDILPGGSSVALRLAGPAPAIEALAQDVLARWPGEKLSHAAAGQVWSDLREFRWAHAQGPLIKVPLAPGTLPALYAALQPLRDVLAHVSSGGNLAFISLPSAEQAATLDEKLQELRLSGLMLRGEGPLWCGTRSTSQIAQSVKQALDPEARFPGLDD